MLFADALRRLAAQSDDREAVLYLEKLLEVEPADQAAHPALALRCLAHGRRELERRQKAPQKDRMVLGDRELDREMREVWRRGRLIEMPQREFDPLRMLMENASKAVSCAELLNQVWGEGWVGHPRTLNVHIC